MIVDIGAKYGEETIRSGKNIVKIIVTPTDAYLSGSADGLTTLMGLTAAEQKKVGNLTIVMKAGTAPYTSFQVESHDRGPRGHHAGRQGYEVQGEQRRNSKDYQLTWKTAATSTASATKSVLTISSGSKTLPIKEVITGLDGRRDDEVLQVG